MATVEENDVLGNVRWTYICLRISLNILVMFFVRLKPTRALQKVLGSHKKYFIVISPVQGNCMLS